MSTVAALSQRRAKVTEVLPVRSWPDPALGRRAAGVNIFDDAAFDDALYYARRMEATLLALGGIGLAGPQVGYDRRLIVIAMTEPALHAPIADPLAEKPAPFSGVFLNPSWTPAEGAALCESNEFCLSVWYSEAVQIQRWNAVTVTAAKLTDNDGLVKFTASLDGLAATCWQHECDHLDGRVIADNLTPLRRDMIRRRRDKLVREAGRRKGSRALPDRRDPTGAP